MLGAITHPLHSLKNLEWSPGCLIIASGLFKDVFGIGAPNYFWEVSFIDQSTPTLSKGCGGGEKIEIPA